jgi:beta-lactamase class A
VADAPLHQLTRRAVALGLAAGALSMRGSAVHAADAKLAALETRSGGRLGLYALDTGSGRSVGWREDERFAMCSTFKWLLAAQLLSAVDAGTAHLDETSVFGAQDLLEYAPVTRAHVADGALSLGALAEAAVTLSDNTAANVLLRRLGGPATLTAFARRLGDPVTRLDRTEPELNENAPGDPRDTTSPRAMAGSLREALLGTTLTPASRQQLLAWLRACRTGGRRLRAGLPEGWTVGDKTGTGSRGAVNDVAIAHPAGGAPLVLTAYASGSTQPNGALEDVLAAWARLARRMLHR